MRLGTHFALTEAEIQTADPLGDRRHLALFNKLTGALLLTSVLDILSRSRSTNWQVSVQLQDGGDRAVAARLRGPCQ